MFQQGFNISEEWLKINFKILDCQCLLYNCKLSWSCPLNIHIMEFSVVSGLLDGRTRGHDLQREGFQGWTSLPLFQRRNQASLVQGRTWDLPRPQVQLPERRRHPPTYHPPRRDGGRGEVHMSSRRQEHICIFNHRRYCFVCISNCLNCFRFLVKQSKKLSIGFGQDALEWF